MNQAFTSAESSYRLFSAEVKPNDLAKPYQRNHRDERINAMKAHYPYHRQTATFVALMLQHMPNLSSEAMQDLIDQPALLRAKLREVFLRKLYEPVVWQEVLYNDESKLGLEYLPLITAAGNVVQSGATNVIVQLVDRVQNRFVHNPKSGSANRFALVTPEQLGLSSGGPEEAVHAFAKDCGLELVPIGLALALALRREVSKGGKVLIGMRPFDLDQNYAFGDKLTRGHILTLAGEDDHVALGAMLTHAERYCQPDEQWVFVIGERA